MSVKINCPVCDRSAIEINICPNCQTDLSLIRMLIELPTLEATTTILSPAEPPKNRWSWQNLTLLISILVNLGLSLWLLM
jgi:hypothetical protein